MLTVLVSWLVALFLSVLASAQGSPVVSSSNLTYSPPSDSSQYIRLAIQVDTAPKYALNALTSEATGILQSGAKRFLNGTLVKVGDDNSGQGLSADAIACVSCDADAYPGNIGVNNVLSNVASANVSAIILYSQTSIQCSLMGDVGSNFTAIYTTTAAKDADSILLQIHDNITAYILSQYTLSQTGATAGQNSTSSLGGPSTAVAMIILYSITGVITALFLAIIVTGAVRAHRHPERYGPRNIVGRARQSRARGIARAMLETIPIVKFGDNDTAKDVEMSEPAEASTGHDAATTAKSVQTVKTTAEPDAAASAGTAATTSVTEAQAASVTTGPATGSPGYEADAVTCSICTEDFERGQDIRLLPCNHKFHPACVDPWLLDVSGTCPLCRVDLRPAETSDEAAREGDMPPPLDPAATDATNSNSTGGRLRGLLRRLQPSTPEERIAALRRFREENPQLQGEEAHASRWERVRRRVRL